MARLRVESSGPAFYPRQRANVRLRRQIRPPYIPQRSRPQHPLPVSIHPLFSLLLNKGLPALQGGLITKDLQSDGVCPEQIQVMDFTEMVLQLFEALLPSAREE